MAANLTIGGEDDRRVSRSLGINSAQLANCGDLPGTAAVVRGWSARDVMICACDPVRAEHFLVPAKTSGVLPSSRCMTVTASIGMVAMTGYRTCATVTSPGLWLRWMRVACGLTLVLQE